MTRHLSSLAVDTLALGVAPDADQQAHLASCAGCRGRIDEAHDLGAQLSPSVMLRTLRALHRRSRLVAAFRVAVPLVLAAAVLAVVVDVRGIAPEVAPAPAPELAIKGGPGLQVYAMRDHRVFEVANGDALAAGDEIRFAVTPAGAGYVLIASVDGGGHATIYIPFNGKRSVAVDPRGRSELIGSIVLDDAPGPERLFALFSTSPLEAADLWPALHRLAAAGPGALRRASRLALSVGAHQVSLLFEKAVP